MIFREISQPHLCSSIINRHKKLIPLKSCNMSLVTVLFLACVALASSAPSDMELKWVKSSSGYEYFPGAGFYKFYEQRVTWGEAWETCVNDGTHLITIDSEKEVGVVKELFGRYTKNYASTQNIAVGFHDLFKKDVFTSIDAVELNTTSALANYATEAGMATRSRPATHRTAKVRAMISRIFFRADAVQCGSV
uniref:C-type lectin domain-containing protein n=1 Tax=Timema shepardi TaxID=629360 RepID=A0A7R9ATC0_TIMSH|nr:unnamed protein product [Timema shepardi]